jgi:predicted transposase/invertase (TIGR01784 family)
MRFINPRTDLAFKRIFGSEQSKAILISFLNALLYQARDTITDLEILNHTWPKIRGIKDTYLSVSARLQDGQQVIIEMQVLNIEGFEKRILYNAAKTYSIQLQQGEGYALLNPVIALTLVDFVLFENLNQVISRFILKERDFLMDYPIYDLELVFVELPKFDKPLEQLDGRLDQWLYFMRHAQDLSMIPESLATVPVLQQAFGIANQVNLTPEELDDLERREIFIQDQRNALLKARKQGLIQGRVEGHAEGLQEGQRDKALAIARALLDVLDDATISQKTGLDLATVISLRATPD